MDTAKPSEERERRTDRPVEKATSRRGLRMENHRALRPNRVTPEVRALLADAETRR